LSSTAPESTERVVIDPRQRGRKGLETVAKDSPDLHIRKEVLARRRRRVQ
jgi:hypothetical protein